MKVDSTLVNRTMFYSDPQTAEADQVNFQKDTQSAAAAAKQQPDTAAMMDYLAQTYKHIDFSIASFDNRSQITRYGSYQTGMNHVSISAELLEKMCTDEKVRQSVEDILSHLSDYQESARWEALLCDKKLVGMGLVIDEDGQVSKWTAMKEKEKEDYPTWWGDRKSTSFYAQKKTSKATSSYNYSHTTNMMRLASARDIKSVKGLISAKYGEIQRVKMQVSDAKEAAAIIRKIRSVIQSGNIKIARLHKEENLRYRQKSAEKKMKEKLALQLAQELRRKQRARMGQEQCQTSHLDDVMPKAGMTDEQFRQIAEQYVESLSSTALSAETAGLVDCAVSDSVSVEVTSAPVASVVDCSA